MTDARRTSLVRRRCAEDREFETWVTAALERADPFMAWLGVLFALLVGYELAVDLGPGASRALAIAGWAIWAVFVVEFLAQLYVAPARTRFLRRHWFQVLGLLLPALRLARLVRLVRLGRALPTARVVTSSYRAAGTARRLAGTRVAYLGAVSIVVTIAIAQLSYLFERSSGTFASFGDAVLWAAGVVIAQQGDPVPVTAAAHVAMLGGFAWGAVVIAALAGTLGALFIDERAERAARESAADTPG